MKNRTAKEKILTIDDDVDLLFLEKLLLEREGYEVFTSLSGKLALEMIPKIPNLGLILCDVEMDQMDGGEFVRHLEEEYNPVFKRTPVVLVTGTDKPPKAHVAGYIQKSAGLSDFAAQIRGFMTSSNTGGLH